MTLALRPRLAHIFGSIYKMPPMVGGIKYEHTHRLIAWSVGVMTIAIAIWTWLVERRAWMKRLAFAALGTVILQGISWVASPC